MVVPSERKASTSDQSSVRISGIEPDGRFVEQHQLRPVQQPARQQQPAAHAARQLIDGGVAARTQPRQRQTTIDRLSHIGDPVEAREHRQVVLDRHVHVQVVELRHHAHQRAGLLGLAGQLVSEHADVARVRDRLSQ